MNHRAIARFHAALSNEVRVRIVALICARKEMCVCELVDELGLSQANVSRHVGILRDAGILQDRKIGTWVLLRVDEALLREQFGSLLDEIHAGHVASVHMDAEQRLTERCGRALCA
ncbi:MAG: metalloregulator ArsR/SmtB family transcription factor [Chloroflexi bacterium]|nr:metalloregulator ArsR/SmtB family transcription factor [Chloroflexota bacterium]